MAKAKQTRKIKSGGRPKSNNRLDMTWHYHVLLAIACILILISRIHFLPIPFDRDEGAYGYLGWMALTGGTPYVDFYEMKPPLLFYSYAVLVAIFGKLPVGFHVASLLINAFETLMIYKIASRIWTASGGAVAALAFVILGAIAQTGGYSLLSEHVVLLYALPGLLLTIKGAQQMKASQLFWGGFLLACSALVKQTAILYCLAGVLIVVLHVFPLIRWERAKLLKALLMFVAGALTPLVFFFFVLLAFGSLDDFWYWFYVHPTSYVSTMNMDQAKQTFLFHWDRISDGHWFWIVLSVSGMAALPFIKTLDWRYQVFLPLMGLLGFLTIVPGMRFYGHYWLLFFPAWSLLAPGMLMLIREVVSRRKSTQWMGLIPVLILAVGLAVQMESHWNYYFKSDLNVVIKQVFRGNFFPEHKLVADFLNKRMKPGDKLLVMGSEPQIYLYTNKKSPTRHVYMAFTSKAIPEAGQWEDEAIRSIDESKPEYIVFMYEPLSWMFKKNSSRKLYNWAFNLTRTQYRTIGHIDLNMGDQMNPILTGTAAVRHTPKSASVIVISERIK